MQNNVEIKTEFENEFLNNIINSIADPIFVKDDKFCFVLVNNAFCEMLGLDKKDVIGKTLGESLPKDQMEHFLKVDKEVFESGQENISEELLTGKGGIILTIITKKTLYIDQKGNKFLVGVIRNISDRKKAEVEIEKKLEELKKMNELMVDRELKMVELKKEIELLKSKLSQIGSN
jgi:PAS domain S-box-containing protein